MPRRSLHLLASLVTLAVLVAPAAAHASPESSLAKCQKAADVEGAKLVQGTVKALTKCLSRIATEYLKEGGSDPSDAAKTCVAALRKIENGADPAKTLRAKHAAKLTGACDPATPGVEHTLADVLGAGATVPQSTQVANLNVWCASFGGDGSIDSIAEWVDCQAAAAVCSARLAVATQYPRTLEWLAAVRPSIAAISPTPTDALAALDAADAAIEGTVDDDRPGLICGTSPLAAGATCSSPAACASGSCVDGVCCDTACTGPCRACNLAGSVGTCTNVPGGTDPANECAGAALCDGAGACALFPNGLGCTISSECASGNCVDGRCCNTACGGSCQACNVTGSVGTCTNVPAGTDPANECAGATTCNGAGLCSLLASGAACTISSECSSGSCVDGVCCSTPCTGICQACTAAKKGSGSNGTCGNILSGTDPDNECAGAATCNGVGACTP
jgi:hypothetical protein